MSEICRKDSLTRNMSRMVKMFPKDYAFYPKAWCLPAEYEFNLIVDSFLFLLLLIFILAIAISRNIIPRGNIKRIYQNRMSVVKVEEYLSPKIQDEISNRKRLN
jgi:hypothetical protein